MKNRNIELNHLVNTQKFKFVFLMMIALSLYGTLYIAYSVDGYIPAFITILSNPYFEMLLLFLFLYNTFQIFQEFDQNYNYIIRLENKKKYVLSLITKVVKNTVILYIIQLSLMIILLNFIYGNNLAISKIFHYSINNFIYLLFFILKSMILYSIIATISVILLKIMPKQIAIIINALLYVSIPIFAVIDYSNIIDSLLKFRFFIGDYLTINRIYTNFWFELSCNGIYILFLLLVIKIIFKYSVNHIKEIG